MLDDGYMEVPENLVENIANLVQQMNEATTLPAMGAALNLLNNEIVQIVTYHPRYNYLTGVIE